MSELTSYNWALVVAHPGHELRAFHFLERARPLVSVLTDGSGSHGVSRLHDTTRLIDETGATHDHVCGRFTDPEVYAQLMTGDGKRFVEVAHQLKRSFERHRITAVLTDAPEGYNPVHDLCRAIAGAGVRLCGAHAPRLFELDLIGHPQGIGPGIRLSLDDGAFARKLDAISRYTALTAEATAAFDLHGKEAFRTEFLRHSTSSVLPPAEYVPYYEQVGDERVRQGRYRSVLRYREHVRPVLAALLSLGAPSLPAGFQEAATRRLVE